MYSPTEMNLYWTLLSYEHWRLFVAATEKGLCFIGSQGSSFEELEEWRDKRRPTHTLIQDDNRLQPYTEQLVQYLRGERQHFTMRNDIQGTEFQMKVWAALEQIPFGHTWSYSDIAAHIHKPEAVRAVGAAIGANPILITVPCHRVIGKNGALTGYRGGLTMKTQLLEIEKIQ